MKHILSLIFVAILSSFITWMVTNTINEATTSNVTSDITQNASPTFHEYIKTLPIYHVEFRNVKTDVAVRFRTCGPTCLMRIEEECFYRFIDADQERMIQVNRQEYYLKSEQKAEGGDIRGDSPKESEKDFIAPKII